MFQFHVRTSSFVLSPMRKTKKKKMIVTSAGFFYVHHTNETAGKYIKELH